MERSRTELGLAIAAAALFGILGGGLWAFAVLEHRVFPYRQLQEVRAVLAGTEGDERPLWQRATGGIGFRPTEFAAPRDTALVDPALLRPVRAARDAPDPLPDLGAARVADLEGRDRLFLIYGSFVFPDLEETLGTILVDTTGTLRRAWPVRTAGGDYRGPHIGLAVSDTGVIATNARGILTAQDWCGNLLWQAPRAPAADYAGLGENAVDNPDWHHDIDFAGGRFYTFVGQRIAGVSARTGAVETEIDLLDVTRWAWDDGLAFLDTRMDIFRPGSIFRDGRVDIAAAAAQLPPDPFHVNKVDVLDAATARAFPGFEAGDMLLSLRELNLVLAIRPAEERIVWWRQGLTSRQHDATFTADGRIEVFNNAPFTRTPTIRRLDLEDHAFSDIFDLTAWQMDMRWKGNFTRRGDRLLTVDDEAGRVIAGRLSGEIDWVFENRIATGDGGSVALQLRNAIEVPAADVARFEAACAGEGG